MYLDSLAYQHKQEEWSIQDIHFLKLTLLVGISGVGKTQILQAINSLVEISKGANQNGLAWDVKFRNEGQHYHWTGEFDFLVDEIEGLDWQTSAKNKMAKLLREELWLNDELITERKGEQIYFEGEKMPKLSFTESLISIFKEEEAIRPAYEGFQKIILRDHTKEVGISSTDYRMEDYQTVEELKAAELPTIVKLHWLYEKNDDLFQDIQEQFSAAFPQVEEIKTGRMGELSSFLGRVIILSIKEKGVSSWIPQYRISSGMLRSLIHIAEMYLLEKGTVVLIDEFENSLGTNCIDILTEDLLYSQESIQFIATSHHPYIINQVPYDYWKLVQRKAGTISTIDAKGLNLGDSKHERFLRLINLKQYRQGVQTS